MQGYLDILGATMLGGFILLIAMTASDNGMREVYNYNSGAMMQNNLALTSRIMEYDLRKMGFGISESDSAVLIGQPDRIKFIAHLNLRSDLNMAVRGVGSTDGVVDTIEYRIEQDEIIDFGDTTVTMYRVTRKVSIANITVDSAVVGRVGDNQVFEYLDQAGNAAPSLSGTKSIDLSLKTFDPVVVLSPELVHQDVGTNNNLLFRKRELARILRPSFFRSNRITAKNLRR